jgi:geranylgeranyl diphosphate synthase type I
MTSFSEFAKLTRPALRQELTDIVLPAADFGSNELHEMVTYQLGWTGKNAGPEAEGKAIRPLLVLLSTKAAGGQWQKSLPAAAAVELIHNFSLIHDDIEDQSDLRRGRPTVWKIWGIAQAINTGDAMFALANQALTQLEKTISMDVAFKAGKLFHTTCLRLTQGQHLDIAFEDQTEIDLDKYILMVGGKTAALLAFCLEVGALCGAAPANIQSAYHDFGHYLGLAFQVQDDILGIWGDEGKSGKSSASDLITGKKTLPVVYGLSQQGVFFERWSGGDIKENNLQEVRQILEDEGGLSYAKKEADRLTSKALAALDQAQPEKNAAMILQDLAQMLLKRQK